MRCWLLLFLLAVPAAAQKDFLTGDEIEQLREAQEADQRLPLYVNFARQRLDMLAQLFASQKTGRSGVIHDTLEQYAQIIEAIDTVIDDALHRKKAITVMVDVAKAEREMLKQLETFAAQESPDRGRYQFALDQAIDTTRDSAELSEQDLVLRTREVEAREDKLKKESEEMLAPTRKDELQKDKAKVEADKQNGPNGKKKPTLLRPGEKAGEAAPAKPAAKPAAEKP